MTDETSKHGPDDTTKTDTVNTDAGAGDSANAQPGVARHSDGEPEQPADPVETLKTENADLKDRYLRTAADMENLRRRTTRDVKDARSYSIAGFARDMLAVSDNLRRALDALPAEAHDSANEGYKTLVEGVEMTERDMLSALERHGVRKIEPEGQKFDPNFHQAMFEVPNTEVPVNTVVQVVQAGYVIGERVLRPAMVGIAKGGAKPEAETDTAADPEPGAPNAQAERDA